MRSAAAACSRAARAYSPYGPASSRDDGTIVYPRSKTAGARDAGVETETDSPAEAYAPFTPWRLGRPDAWAGLRWV
jgi:hypothetical protein